MAPIEMDHGLNGGESGAVRRGGEQSDGKRGVGSGDTFWRRGRGGRWAGRGVYYEGRRRRDS